MLLPILLHDYFDCGSCTSDRIRPQILCGTSVGAINAAKLAEGEAIGNDTQGSAGLAQIWASLQTNDDMYLNP